METVESWKLPALLYQLNDRICVLPLFLNVNFCVGGLPVVLNVGVVEKFNVSGKLPISTTTFDDAAGRMSSPPDRANNPLIVALTVSPCSLKSALTTMNPPETSNS